MTEQNKVYLAGDVIYAFIDRTHAKHDQAAAFFRYFSMENYQLATDVVTLYDTFTILSQDVSPTIAKDFIRSMYISSVTIFYPTEADMKAALKTYLSDKTGDLTLGKTLMAVLADKNRIPQIATFEYIHAVFGLSIFYIPL